MGKDKSSKAAFGLKSGAAKARVGAKKAAKVSLDAIKAGGSAAAGGAKVVGDAAAKAKTAVGRKTRAALNAEYEKKRVVALASLAKSRAANPDCTPSEIFDILASDLDSVDANDFSSAASLFAVTAWQLRNKDAVETARQRRFINLMVAVDSSAVRFGVKAVDVVAAYGPAALAIAKKVPGRVGKAAKGLELLLGKGKSKVPNKANNAKIAAFVAKAAWLPAVLKLVGVKNVGKKSAGWLLASATKKSLGEMPESWQDTLAENWVANGN